MKLQKLIFMIGPDRCGKSQIAHELSCQENIPYFKASSEHASFLSSRVSKDDQFLNQLRFADPRVLDLLRQTQHSVIFDRGYPCEYVYSQILNRETDMVMLKHLDKEYAKLGAMIVLCHRSTYAGINDDLDPTIDEQLLKKLHDAYFEFAKWTNCRLYSLNVDSEDLLSQVKLIQDFMGESK